jgi:hypothetical protein
MRVAIYTSLAVNYLAKARVLVKSIKAVNPDIDVIGVICDRFPIGLDPAQEDFDQIWMVDEYPTEPVKAWIYRHNIMELCTAVKGWGLQRLLAAGYDYVFYLDPDCWVLQDPLRIIELMKTEMSVLVVPHTTSPAETDEGIRLVEISSLKHGIYNLGFLLVRNDQNGRTFAKWWSERLHHYCLIRFEDGVFTDQRWFDLAVGYFPFIQVTWHKGIDVASWNIGQRTITRSADGAYLVDGDPLIFYHFSGVGPAGVHRWVRDIFAPSDPLAAELEFSYEGLIKQAGQERLETIRPAYDTYDDGAAIDIADRVEYRADEEINRLQFPDPYKAGADAKFRTVTQRVASPAAEFSLSPDEVERLAMRLFDLDFYRDSLQRQSASVVASWETYKSGGWESLTNPNRYFDNASYRALVPASLRTKYPTPLHHFIAAGRQRGIPPVWFFDEAYYLKRYTDVLAAVASQAFSSGFEHFLIEGCLEGRQSSALFDEANYVRTNKDVAAAISAGLFANGGQHYLRFGHQEGRMAVFASANADSELIRS